MRSRPSHPIIVSIVGVSLILSTAAAVAGTSDTPTVNDGHRPDPIPSAGCGTDAARAVPDDAGSMMVEGMERSWSIHVPPAHDGTTPIPLVILLHGLGEDSGVIRYFTIPGLPDQEGFAIVAPLGSGLISRWMWDLDDSEYDLSMENPDIAFIDALIDDLAGSLCLDMARIYAAGYSNGAIGVSALGCVLEDRVAAIAPVAALTDFGEACSLERPMPVLALHGREDPYVLFEGGWGPGLADFTMEDFVSFADQPITSWPGFQASITDRAATISGRQGCAEEARSELIAEDVERLSWDCPPGAEVELIVVHGGGHAWPTTPLDASAAIWEFFSRQALPDPSGA